METLAVITINGNYTENALNSSNSLADPDRLLQGNASLTIPLYRGGRVANSVKGAEIRSDAARDLTE